MPEGSFISYEPTYKVGEYFDRFHKDSCVTPDKGQMTYYFFDPTEHGFPKDKSYPLFVFLHGTSNSLEGDVCINYAGAEFYATDAYQKDVGGAYILVPLANEHRDETGAVQGAWDETYIKAVYELVCGFIEAHTYCSAETADASVSAVGAGSSAATSVNSAGAAPVFGASGKKVVFGNSSGATMSFLMVTAYTSFFNALVPVGTASIPTDEELDRYDANDVHLFFAIGKRDEIHPFKEKVEPRLPRLERMKHCFIYTPEWVRNGDKGIASINFGFEMGQHCLVNPMHCNLMFDDGTNMEPRLPHGVTGWLASFLNDESAADCRATKSAATCATDVTVSVQTDAAAKTGNAPAKNAAQNAVTTRGTN